MGRTDTSPSVRTLQRFLAVRDHESLLDSLSDPSIESIARHNDFVRALVGEGLCLLLNDSDQASRALLTRYGSYLESGLLLVPAETIETLAKRLQSKKLGELAKRARRLEACPPHGKRLWRPHSQQAGSERATCMEVRRVIQKIQVFLGDSASSDNRGIRQSVFRSHQEREFLKALSLRFPSLLALPNYPLDQIAKLEHIRHCVDEDTWQYGVRCRMDAILVIPDVGDPVAAFELDSRFHDSPEVLHRDRMKNTLLQLIGLPFFRLRVEAPESMAMDEWYALLTDQVVPNLDIGDRIRCRMPNYSLVPA